MDTIIKVVVIGIIGAVLAVTIREYKKEFALFVGIVTGIVILYMLMGSILSVKSLIDSMIVEAGINSEYISIIAKVIVIAYICEFGVQFCNDANEKGIATKVELAGRILIFGVSLPILERLFNLIINLSI